MSAVPPVVWVVAGVGAAERWVPVLREKSLAAAALAWSRVRPQAVDPQRFAHTDLLLFTSRLAVEALPAGAGLGVPVVCVGAATAAAARARGHEVVLVGRAGGEALAREVLRTRPEARRVVFPCAQEARPEAPAVLRAGGVQVDPVVAYAVEPDPAFAAAVARAPHPAAVVLGSPRAVDALQDTLAALGRTLPPDAGLVALGAVTAERAAARLERYVAVAAHADPESLAQAVWNAVAGARTTGRNHDA